MTIISILLTNSNPPVNYTPLKQGIDHCHPRKSQSPLAALSHLTLLGKALLLSKGLVTYLTTRSFSLKAPLPRTSTKVEVRLAGLLQH